MKREKEKQEIENSEKLKRQKAVRDKVKNLEKLRNEKLKEKIVGGGDISNEKKRNSKSRAVPSQDT